jgi:hypothetical protein
MDYLQNTPTALEYSIFSASHGTFFEVVHILGHKTSLNKYKKIEIPSCIFIRS